MVIELRWQEQHAAETAIVRRQAGSLLQRLVASRDVTEEHSVQTGRLDPMKLVTGRTAIDGAIVMTHRIVAQTDELLRELQGDDAC